MSTHTIIILLTLVGFGALAALLLIPVYRFLQREELVSRKWTAEHDVEALAAAEDRRGASENVDVEHGIQRDGA